VRWWGDHIEMNKTQMDVRMEKKEGEKKNRRRLRTGRELMQLYVYQREQRKGKERRG
jgi:hypothetical protein